MSPKRASRNSSSWRKPWLFVVGLALLGVAAWFEGPVLAHQVWEQLGVRRVEEHVYALHAAADESGIDVCLLAGLVYVESRGNVAAKSSVGALGLCQLMPAAASDAARRLHLPTPTPAQLTSDALLNARLGANHLAQLEKLLGPDPERMLVAYNAGRGRLLEWEKAAGGWAAWRKRHAEKNDSPTLIYAQDVLACAQRFRARGVLVPLAAEPAPRSSSPSR